MCRQLDGPLTPVCRRPRRLLTWHSATNGVLVGQMVDGQNAPQSGVRISMQDLQNREVAAVFDRSPGFLQDLRRPGRRLSALTRRTVRYSASGRRRMAPRWPSKVSCWSCPVRLFAASLGMAHGRRSRRGWRRDWRRRCDGHCRAGDVRRYEATRQQLKYAVSGQQTGRPVEYIAGQRFIAALCVATRARRATFRAAQYRSGSFQIGQFYVYRWPLRPAVCLAFGGGKKELAYEVASEPGSDLGGNRSFVQRIEAVLLRLVDAGLAATIFLVPLVMGGRTALGQLLLVVLACGIGVCWCLRQGTPLIQPDPLARSLLVLAVLFFLALQIVPLPEAWLARLSPHVYQLLPLWAPQAGEGVAVLGHWRTLSFTPAETRDGLLVVSAFALLFVVVVQRVRQPQDVETLLRWIAAGHADHGRLRPRAVLLRQRQVLLVL